MQMGERLDLKLESDQNSYHIMNIILSADCHHHSDCNLLYPTNAVQRSIQ